MARCQSVYPRPIQHCSVSSQNGDHYDAHTLWLYWYFSQRFLTTMEKPTFLSSRSVLIRIPSISIINKRNLPPIILLKVCSDKFADDNLWSFRPTLTHFYDRILISKSSHYYHHHKLREAVHYHQVTAMWVTPQLYELESLICLICTNRGSCQNSFLEIDSLSPR